MESPKRFFIKHNIPCFERFRLASRSSIRIGGDADYAVFPDEVSLQPLILYLLDRKIPFLPVGGLTNLLISDDGFRGVTVFSDRLSNIESDGRFLSCGAGVRLPMLAKFAAENSLSGFEELSGIPGTVGGAICQNAGAFGREIADTLEEVTAFDFDLRKTVCLQAGDLAFGYRNSVLKNKSLMVIKAKFKLTVSTKEAVMNLCEEYRKKRIETQPFGLPSLGSFYKRTEIGSAGMLIDRIGLKGFSIGDAAVSEKHAGFVVNLGSASAADVVTLSDHLRAEVKKAYKIDLKEEIERIGF